MYSRLMAITISTISLAIARFSNVFFTISKKLSKLNFLIFNLAVHFFIPGVAIFGYFEILELEVTNIVTIVGLICLMIINFVGASSRLIRSPLFNILINRWLNNHILSCLSKIVQALLNGLYNSFYSYFNPIFYNFCENYNKSKYIDYPIEEFFNQLYLTLVPSKWNILGTCILYYNIMNGCFLEGELFVFNTTVNTYLSNIFLFLLLCIFCVNTAYFFIHNTSNFKIKHNKIYRIILVLFFICFFVLFSYLIYILFYFYQYLFGKFWEWILKFGTPGPSGSQPSGNPQGGGQPSGGNPQGPQGGPPGGNHGLGSASNSYDNEDRDSRSRSSSPCTKNNCYYPGVVEDDEGFIKYCHRNFYRKTFDRIDQMESKDPLKNPEPSFKPKANIVHNSGVPYLDYTDHELKSGLSHLNDQHHKGYIQYKPEGNPQSLTFIETKIHDNGEIQFIRYDCPLAGQARVESAGSVLYLKNGKYHSLTNSQLKYVVKKSWTENSRK
jgi:hypothetical protein